ncbi:hypothetical protein G9A89_006510 [Geosiphon pyriformis]|nr:hypothetical protein G9A89_006510 [Geosiphon pyriformis]
MPNPNSQNYLSLLVTPEDVSTNNLAFAQKQPLTSNIPPTTITEDESLAAIFPFEFEETTTTPLFSGATLKAKPITAMYTDAKVKRQSIKLILDSGSACSIITRQLIDQLGRRVDRAISARIITANGATKTPIGKINDFLFEINGIVTLIKVLTPPREKLLIELEEEKEKPIWKAYQVSWANANHNELPPILLKNHRIGRKKREEENTQANNTYIPYIYSQQQSLTYCRPKLICVNCGKKLSSMGACCGNNEEYQMATKFYCRTCHVECFGRPKQNDIPEKRGTCDVSCQYTILISDWVKKKTPIETAWRRAVQQLDSCPHNDDELWRMAITKIEDTSPEEIKTIKNNPPEPIKLD